MNILILVSSLNFGGAEKQATLDANMLANDHQVFLGMFETGALSEQLSAQVKPVMFRKQGYLSTARQLAEFVKSNNIQIIHNHLYAPMIIASLASLRVSVPVLWHFHGHHFEVRKLPLNILSQLPTVKHTIFVCDALADYFDRHFWFPASKRTVVYNSSQCRKLPDVHPADDTLRIGFIGRVVGLKRLHYLVNLATFLKEQGLANFEIQIVGDGPEREKLEAQANVSAVAHLVNFLGFRPDIEHLYNQFDLFTLPSQEEALSLALIDAGNCGLPALAFDVGGNREIILDGKTGYIVRSEEDLQEKAYRLCQDEALRKKLGAAAEQHTHIFSEASHRQQLLDIYRTYVPEEKVLYETRSEKP